jgi:indolepyruvate ferredoxin oxidoreductase beta subunit
MAKGYVVTVGETFGASQRGGSVMSHLRISTRSHLSPQIPRQRADVILALEAMEALRVLGNYGNRRTLIIANRRPVYPMSVIAGEREYPSMDQIRNWLERFSRHAWLIDATGEAMALGAPIHANIVMIGALAATRALPFERQDFERVLSATMPADRVANNLEAFDTGARQVG